MIYFDSAATTFQKPRSVADAMERALATMSSPGRGGYPAAMAAADAALDCRTELAEMYGAASPEQVVFTLNATHALNIAIKSLVPAGGRAVISGYEHNAVTRPLTALGARVTVAAAPLFRPAAAEEAFDRCFTQPPPEETPPAETAGPAPAGSPEPTDSPAPSDAPVPAETTQPSPEPEPSPSPEPEPEPEPEASWSYDEGRLLEAWTAGDWSGLHEKDRAILDRCREVLDTVVPAGGSEYDRELAVHDWMVEWASYDSNTLSLLPDFREDPDNGNPYGLLVNGRGICSGYTSTFQLFMDLLGIECITVEGTAYGGSEAHAWNQVRLDGEWYCVDVTWDDPVASFPVLDWMAHSYFNVTGDYMRRTDHQWDESAVPEATGTAYAWRR